MDEFKSIAFATLGCKLNYAETENIARALSEKGFIQKKFNETADFYVINTCYVTQSAEKKSKALIKQAYKRNPNSIIAVMGCFSQLAEVQIKQIEGVKIVLGASNKTKIVNLLVNYSFIRKEELCDISIDTTYFPSYSLGNRTRVFLKIQDGCDNFCGYCTIPYARGRSRSDSIPNILANIDKILESETKEIVFTGVNIGDFQKGRGLALLELLKEIEKNPVPFRLRISSIEPDFIPDELIEFIAKSDKLMPHFHIPLQSGSDNVLKAMKRKYNLALFESKIRSIMRLMPNACIACDVIVGYPGETADDFDDTYRFIDSLPIAYLHVFPFSARPGTYASKLPHFVSDGDKKHRSIKLLELSEQKKNAFYLSNKGNAFNVLFESSNNNGFMFGFTDNYIRVKTRYRKDWVNQIVPVRLTEMDQEGNFFL